MRSAGLSCLLLIVGAAFVQAQEPAARQAELAMRADGLHAQAMEKQSNLSTLSDAARLHMQEVELRPVYDVSAVDCLTLAGNLYYSAKRPLDARRSLEMAGDRALALGDVQRAAILYLNASFAAKADNAPEEARRLGQRADLLTASPLLTPAQREDIHRRWTHPTTPGKTNSMRAALQADSLHAEALVMQQDGRIVDAARLYRSEAKLRLREDPGAVDNLMLASHLLFVANRPLDARRTLEEAGDRALGAGDVQRAALAFLEGAFIADKEGNRAEATRLGRRAELLSVSDLLTPQQRQDITRRIRRMPAT